MYIHLIDNINCLICGSSQWVVEGNILDEYVTNGSITCLNLDNFIIQDNILYLGNNLPQKNTRYQDYSITGYPKEVNDNERSEFLSNLNEIMDKLIGENLKVVFFGESYLFFEYLKKDIDVIYFIHHDETYLKHIYEMAINKQVHRKIVLVCSDMFTIVESLPKYYFFPKDKNSEELTDINYLIFFSRIDEYEILWSSNTIKLQLQTK
ncbi:MAG: hypothetical protein OEZ01_05770 [Candidatus Heimdallarchaeota archaeon]|nr:hypothetical protein [Candidatus Heimdallarchaeota archaeon]MDH5645493.1 hypothetical protein [Candidatus Heimdallarchaeota archaeon]